jgi:hypothetical protein
MRSAYSPVSVFTLRISPSFIKRGVFTFIPFSRVTCFVPPSAVFPFMAGGASVTLKEIFIGSFMLIGFSWK